MLDLKKEVKELHHEIIGDREYDGYAVKLRFKGFDLEEYERIAQKLKDLNDEMRKGQHDTRDVLGIVELGSIFYNETLFFLCDDATEEFCDVMRDAENTFGPGGD